MSLGSSGTVSTEAGAGHTSHWSFSTPNKWELLSTFALRRRHGSQAVDGLVRSTGAARTLGGISWTISYQNQARMMRNLREGTHRLSIHLRLTMTLPYVGCFSVAKLVPVDVNPGGLKLMTLYFVLGAAPPLRNTSTPTKPF